MIASLAAPAPPSPVAGEPLISTRALTKRYGELTAVDRLDLEVRAGEVYGLLGPNGAGKTTTILMLLGLSEPSSGEARVVGLDPTRAPLEVKRRVGYLPDNVGFYPGMTGRQNLRYTARLNGLGRDDGEARIETVLGQVGLTDVADRRFEAFSRGMRQRLGIADALLKDPDVLILDEPTIAIDPAGVAEILGLIRRLADDHRLALLLASHMLGQVQTVCDRVGIFVGGRKIAEGRVAELARTFGRGEITIEVGVAEAAGPDPLGMSPERALRSISGVTEVTRDATDQGRWLVTSSGDIRAAIPGALEASGLHVVHLRGRDEGLDEVYRHIVGEATGAAPAEEPGDDDVGS